MCRLIVFQIPVNPLQPPISPQPYDSSANINLQNMSGFSLQLDTIEIETKSPPIRWAFIASKRF